MKKQNTFRVTVAIAIAAILAVASILVAIVVFPQDAKVHLLGIALFTVAVGIVGAAANVKLVTLQ